ncbi:MAG: DUF29 domain-containing protein [Hormoscilla sp. GM102CHS1]|nr:DUF29 domain-containing protein [Hormoscilla sp. GM102CHS1]
MTRYRTITTGHSSLYDRDYYLWLQGTVKRLQQGKFAELDIANLIEELTDMGKRERRALESNLVVLLMHLLKYPYQVEKRSHSWLATIFEHRRRLRKAFQDSPSLKNYFLEVFDECYLDARQLAALETGFPLDTFPIEATFDPEESLDSEFLLDQILSLIC